MVIFSKLKQTKVYQEAQLDAKIEVIPNLVKEGFNSEKIAQLLNLPLDTVKNIVEGKQQEN